MKTAFATGLSLLPWLLLWADPSPAAQVPLAALPDGLPAAAKANFRKGPWPLVEDLGVPLHPDLRAVSNTHVTDTDSEAGGDRWAQIMLVCQRRPEEIIAWYRQRLPDWIFVSGVFAVLHPKGTAEMDAVMLKGAGILVSECPGGKANFQFPCTTRVQINYRHRGTSADEPRGGG